MLHTGPIRGEKLELGQATVAVVVLAKLGARAVAPHRFRTTGLVLDAKELTITRQLPPSVSPKSDVRAIRILVLDLASLSVEPTPHAMVATLDAMDSLFD